ncbi:MAG: tRNA (adenine(22)-N(1))-methyltransferase TrmK [Bacilli bacterium]|jgi:tRNA (adenine22-N1)-methyltransferase|nr:tRNA (adenine(22)-N(1))-methyltransferase TrmK [Bacilli bacterium]
MIKLSARLLLVYSFIKPASGFIDIGADGGKIVIKLAEDDYKGALFASEYQNGPYKRLVKGVLDAGFNNRITLLQGNGLSVIHDPLITEVLLSGMGGGLIEKLINESNKTLKQIERIIIEPQSEPFKARKALIKNGFKEENGLYLKERGHFYPLESYVKGEEKEEELTLNFGSTVFKRKDKVFKEFILKEKERLTSLLKENLPLSKKAELENELRILNEAERRIGL